MSEHRSAEVTPHEAVLGLLAQGRTTVEGLKGRLAREFPHANYAPNTASMALRRLVEKGQAQLVKHGDDDTTDVYEITRPGVNVFEDWLYEVVSIPSPQRDAIQAKLAFVPVSGVGRFLGIIKILQEAAAHQYGVEHGKVKTIEIGRGVGRNPDLELERIRHQYTASLWGAEQKRLAALCKSLEIFRAKYGGD
jgi:DNA-binding PadR family transcriptional regulator